MFLQLEPFQLWTISNHQKQSSFLNQEQKKQKNSLKTQQLFHLKLTTFDENFMNKSTTTDDFNLKRTNLRVSSKTLNNKWKKHFFLTNKSLWIAKIKRLEQVKMFKSNSKKRKRGMNIYKKKRIVLLRKVNLRTWKLKNLKGDFSQQIKLLLISEIRLINWRIKTEFQGMKDENWNRNEIYLDSKLKNRRFPLVI